MKMQKSFEKEQYKELTKSKDPAKEKELNYWE